MTFDMTQDKVFNEIARDLDLNKGLLEDAWVHYQSEKWYPVIVKAQQTGVRGFEVNPTGKWGKNAVVGRQKISLENFLIRVADGSFPDVAAVRCKSLAKKDRNGRDISNLEMSERLLGLIARYQSKSSSPSVVTSNHQTLNIVPKYEANEDLDNSSLLADLDEIDSDPADENDPTERLDNRMSRIGQGKFRKNTIATWGGKERCAVTGVAIREVLTASHIIPWSKDVVQRKRGCNGILLTAHLDRLFDRHLIGFRLSPEVNVFSLVIAPRLADRFLDLEPLGVTARTELDLSTVNPADRPGLETNLRAHLDLVLNNK